MKEMKHASLVMRMTHRRAPLNTQVNYTRSKNVQPCNESNGLVDVDARPNMAPATKAGGAI